MERFFNTWHPDGYRVFSICNDLQKTLQFSTNPDLRLEPLQLAIHPCFKFKPQLSERLTTSYKTLVKSYKESMKWILHMRKIPRVRIGK